MPKSLSKSTPPRLALLACCDHVARDPNSKKLTLYGVYDTVIPVDKTNFGLLVVARFFGGTGEHEMTFRLHNTAGTRVGWDENNPKAKFKCKKQGFVDIVANISKISINRDGWFELCVECDGELLTHSYPIRIQQQPQKKLR